MNGTLNPQGGAPARVDKNEIKYLNHHTKQ